jgi:hypothetical protein
MEKEILYNGVVVYRNAVPNKEKIINFLKECDYWQDWYDVGKEIPLAANDNIFNYQTFPTKEEWDSKVNSWNNAPFFQRYPEAVQSLNWLALEEAFYNTTQDYVSLFPVEDIPNWYRGGANFLRYDAKSEDEVTIKASGTEKYALPFHTDFPYQVAHKEGVKPALTVTMYLNDDYEGGDIEYRIYDKHFVNFRIEGEQMIEIDTGHTIPGFNYKPKAGDIIIFPSKLPYYHGVKKITAGQKLFLRTFWMYNPETPHEVVQELQNLPRH